MQANKISYGNPISTEGLDKLSDILGMLKAKVKNSPLGQGVINTNNFLAKTLGPKNQEELDQQQILSKYIEGINPTVTGSIKDISSIVKPARTELLRRILGLSGSVSEAKGAVPQNMFSKYQPQLKEILGGGKIDPKKVQEELMAVDPRYNIGRNRYPEIYGELQQTLKSGVGQDVVTLNMNHPYLGEANPSVVGILQDRNYSVHPEAKGLSNFNDMDNLDRYDMYLDEFRGNPVDFADTILDIQEHVEETAPQFANRIRTLVNQHRTVQDSYHVDPSIINPLREIMAEVKASSAHIPKQYSDAGMNNIGWARVDELNPQGQYGGQYDYDRYPDFGKYKGSYLVDELQSDIDTWKRPTVLDRNVLNTYSPKEVWDWAQENSVSEGSLSQRNLARLMASRIDSIVNRSGGERGALEFVNRMGMEPIITSFLDGREGSWKDIVSSFGKKKASVPTGPDLKDPGNVVGDAYKGWEDVMMTNLINQGVKDNIPGIFLHSPESIIAKGDGAGLIDSVNKRYYEKLPKTYGFEETLDHPFNFEEWSRKPPMWYLDLGGSNGR